VDLEIGGQIEGEVTKTTQFGAFVRLKEGVQGLAHISELGENIKNTEDIVKAGQSYQFRILSIDPLQHKISLSYRSADVEPPVPEPTSPKKSVVKKTKARSKKSE
jgi:predicted RNA-binding protein with RPS1 domain